MHDPGGVRFREPLGHLRRDRQKPLLRQRPVDEHLSQRDSVHQLHRHVGGRAVCPDVVDRDDVRVVERRGRLRFLLEAPQAAGVGSERFRQDLERHLASEARVPCPVYLPHPARAQVRENLVRTEAAAGGKAHLQITRSPDLPMARWPDS